MDAEFVLYVTHSHSTVALVIDKHRQATSVVGSLFRTGEHQVYVGVTVGDEALHAVEIPALVFLAVGSLEHHTLQVTTGIRLGEVHTHGLASTHTWDVLFALLL